MGSRTIALATAVGEHLTGVLLATLGLMTSTTGSILWFPMLYLALPAGIFNFLAYFLCLALLTGIFVSSDKKPMAAAFVCVLTGFIIASCWGVAIYFTTTLCTMASYAATLHGQSDSCSVCVSGNLFMIVGAIFWVGAGYQIVDDVRQKDSPLEQEWSEEKTSNEAAV